MGNMKTAILFFGVVAVALGLSLVPAVHADSTLVWKVCNGAKIPDGSSFWGNLGSLLVDLEENTVRQGYNYRTQKSGGGTTAYGLATCNTQATCHSCLVDLGNQIWNTCGNAIGARVQYVDCFLRYENYSFSLSDDEEILLAQVV